MATIADFVPYVAPYASGCSDIVIKRAIVEAIDTFCKDSWYYKERITAQRILGTDTVVGDFDADFPGTINVNGTDLYPIIKTLNDNYVCTAPTGMRPWEVQEVRTGQKTLRPVGYATLQNVDEWFTREGESAYFTRLSSKPMEVFPTPQDPEEFTITVVYTTLPTATEVPDLMFNDYRQTIADGALSMLYAQPDQGYSDPQASAMKLQNFRSGITNARIRTRKGNTRASVQAVPRRWV